jgi:DNA invertase Pin-like site-specific DNA recombinase
MTKLVGYARVSTSGQSFDVQTEILREAGCSKLFAEKRSGRSAADRDQLRECLDFVREGDTLVVTRLDRLARSVSDLFKILGTLQDKGVSFRCLQQAGVNTDTSSGRLTLAILGAVAAFEADILKERQLEGIQKAKAAGVYKGRKPSVDVAAVMEMHKLGVRPSEIAKQLRIGRASVYRALAIQSGESRPV